jgi:hypothetical protein
MTGFFQEHESFSDFNNILRVFFEESTKFRQLLQKIPKLRYSQKKIDRFPDQHGEEMPV